MPNNNPEREIASAFRKKTTLASSRPADRQNTRMTKQRAMILAELRALTCHPTADEIYSLVRRKLPRISLGTVYRNLELLAENREILKLEYAGFQKRFDGNLDAHQHVRCMRCGKVGDVGHFVELPKLPENLQVRDFKIFSACVEFFGLCEQCQREEGGLSAESS